MNLKNELEKPRKRREHPHKTPYLGLDPYHGVPIQCQYCSGQSFRRSSLRSDDFSQLILMRYPVRCIRCGQRQMVSYTVASLSISSKIKPRRRHRPVDASSRWIDFTRHPDAPNPLASSGSEETSDSLERDPSHVNRP
jgi:hypothetical protein